MRVSTIKAATALGSLFAAIAVSTASAGPSKTFGDWVVSCSDGLTCTASVTRAGDDPIAALEIRRPIDPGAPASLVIALAREEKPTGDVAFAVDGAEPVRIPAARFAKEEVGTGFSIPEADGGGEVRAAMRDGRAVRIEMPTIGPRLSAEFSLKGLAASLLFMDEAQKRDGTKLAFVALGDKPAPDPAALPSDIASRTELPASVANLWEAEGCADVDEASIGTLGFSTPIQEGRLFGLICGSPGAYNVNYALFADHGDSAAAVPFPGIDAKGPVAAMTAMNLDWDDRARRLGSFGKGRGLGDCGIWQSWIVGDDGGLTLTEAREKDDCDGKDADFDQWPKLWPPAK